jgi:hypothetical protein
MAVGLVMLVPRWSLREGEGLVQQVFRGAQQAMAVCSAGWSRVVVLFEGSRVASVG